jgi:hypothetical protein
LDDVFSKEAVSEDVIFLHNREMTDAQIFAKTAQALDSIKFTSPEFVLLLKIRYFLSRGIEGYERLKNPTELLQVAIAAKDSFIRIFQIELRYRATKQQELYTYAENLLAQGNKPDDFRQEVQEKVTAILPQVKTEEGKTAVESYGQELNKISGHRLGLKLLSLFKSYNLADYSILRVISDLVDTLSEQEATQPEELLKIVKKNYEVFSQLSKIIGITKYQNTPETHVKMLQYLTLAKRHEKSFPQFQELVQVMQKWNRPHQAIVRIREEYSPKEYKQPQEFSEEIPGLKIYTKYKKSPHRQESRVLLCGLWRRRNV